jgi:hypothetical protein
MMGEREGGWEGREREIEWVALIYESTSSLGDNTKIDFSIKT